MRIGFFTTHFPYRKPFSSNMDSDYFCGGEGEVAYNLSINLMKKGHNVRVFTTSANNEDVLEKYERITMHRYGKSVKIFDTYFSFKLVHCPSKYEVDVAHAHFSTFPGPLAALAYIRKKKKPFVITYHLDPVADYGSIVRRASVLLFRKFVVDTILRQADCIIVFSEDFIQKSEFLQKYRDKIEVIPNGIDLHEFTVGLSKSDCRAKLGLSDGEFIVLFVGSLTERKGPDVLLRAISRVRKHVTNVRLIFVGPSLGRLENVIGLARKLHLKSTVDFKGFVSEYEKKLYFASADLFVLPSFSEGFPITLLEASAFGLPIIASDLEVFRPIITDNYNGIFAKRGDDEDFANKISYLYENEELRDKMGKLAKEKVESFSWDKIVSKTEKLYLDLLDSERK